MAKINFADTDQVAWMVGTRNASVIESMLKKIQIDLSAIKSEELTIDAFNDTYQKLSRCLVALEGTGWRRDL